MMPDLVDQYVPNDLPQRLIMLGPVVQDRPPVEPDQIGQPGDVTGALMRQAGAVKQAQQIEFAFRAHFIEYFVRREILYPEDDAFAQIAESFRQPRQDV